MKSRIVDKLNDIISSISYGDITRNTLESDLESLKDSINEYLIEGYEQ